MNSHVWKKCWRPIGIAFGAFALLAAPAGAANQGDPLKLGVVNTINLSTSLSGNTPAYQLAITNTNVGAVGAIKGQSSSAATLTFSVYGLLTSTAPAGSSAAVRGENKGTNANGFGVWGSHAGGGTGVYGSAPTGVGTFGTSTSGIGVRAHSQSGRALYATVTGGNPAVQADTSSGASGATGVVGTATAAGAAANSAGVKGVNLGNGMGVFGRNGNNVASGYGVYGEGRYGVVGKSLFGGSSSGVYGTSASGFAGVEGHSASATGNGVLGDNSVGGTGVYGSSASGRGVWGKSRRPGRLRLLGPAGRHLRRERRRQRRRGDDLGRQHERRLRPQRERPRRLRPEHHRPWRRRAQRFQCRGVRARQPGCLRRRWRCWTHHRWHRPCRLRTEHRRRRFLRIDQERRGRLRPVGERCRRSRRKPVRRRVDASSEFGHSASFRGGKGVRIYAEAAGGDPGFSNTGAALQVDAYNNQGEAGWFRLADSTNPYSVLMLIKQSAGNGDFMKCLSETARATSPRNATSTRTAPSSLGRTSPSRCTPAAEKSGYSPGDVLVASAARPGDVDARKKPLTGS